MRHSIFILTDTDRYSPFSRLCVKTRWLYLASVFQRIHIPRPRLYFIYIYSRFICIIIQRLNVVCIPGLMEQGLSRVEPLCCLLKYIYPKTDKNSYDGA